MSENLFKHGDVVWHTYGPFDHFDLFVVKILYSGTVVCRYQSYHNPGKEGNSQFKLHQMEFEPLELTCYVEKPAQVLGAYFS